ncbi:MAG: amino acid adenylation domain-containing protein [Cyanothece sp. SIO1E1]|nr:amino acid adenylation domain-containing protein [Cyanothece sp. SIO1E1]
MSPSSLPPSPPPPISSLQNLAYLIFTSGSTGQPKAVMIEHRQLLNYVQGIQARLNLPTPANFATVSTVAADLGNTAIFPALCSGSCLHLISSARASDPLTLAQYLHHHTIDCLKIVPSHLNTLLGAIPNQSIVPPQKLVLGGEATHWPLIEQLRQRATTDFHVLNHYGPTETTIGVLTYAIRDRPTHHGTETVPLGRPLPNTKIYVLDQHLHPVPIGAPGELYIGGDNLTRGYWHHPDLTAERFMPNLLSSDVADNVSTTPRLYKTGDLVRYLPDGNLEFLGRIDQQVKIRGFRVELGEIEARLVQHPGVNQAVVTPWTLQPGELRLAAYVVRKPEPLPTIADLRQFLREHLPDYMLPAAWMSLPHLPITANGKIDYQALPEPNIARSELAAAYVAPRTELEATLAAIWAETLQVEKVGIQAGRVTQGL